MIMRNSNTNAYDLFDIRNNQIVGAHQIAAVGSQLQLAGFADINGDGTQDMVLRDSRNGSFEYYDIVNGQVTAEGVLGQSGLEWTVVGLTDDPAATNTSAAPSSDLQAQPAEGGRDAWLTQAMQAAGAGGQSSLAGTTPAAGPGFDSGSSLTTGSTEWAASPVVTQNVLQQQHIA